MNKISNEALEFLNEAKESFIKNDKMVTYTDKEKGFIALRTGFRDDCIMVYELGNEVGNFVQQLPSQHKVLVDYDEIEIYKKLKEQILPNQINEVMNILDNDLSGKYVEHNKGFLSALQLILNTLNTDKEIKQYNKNH